MVCNDIYHDWGEGWAASLRQIKISIRWSRLDIALFKKGLDASTEIYAISIDLKRPYGGTRRPWFLRISEPTSMPHINCWFENCFGPLLVLHVSDWVSLHNSSLIQVAYIICRIGRWLITMLIWLFPLLPTRATVHLSKRVICENKKRETSKNSNKSIGIIPIRHAE